MNRTSPPNPSPKEGGKYSQLRAMLSITRASLRSITRNPSSIVFSILFPVIFIIVFGFIGGGDFTVTVGITKSSDTNNSLYHAVTTMHNTKIITDAPDSELVYKLKRGKIDGIIDIGRIQDSIDAPKFRVSLRTSSAASPKSAVLILALNTIISKANLNYLESPVRLAELHEEFVEAREYKTIDFILPGQLGFSILGAGVFGTAFVFIILRDTLVLKRFFATPIKKRYIILGEALSRLIFSMSTAVVIILIGHFFFGFTLVHGAVTVINMLIVSAIGLFVFLGFGFMVSGIAKNVNAVPPIANLITLPQFLLAGTFFSIDVFPSWLQPIGRAVPLTYLNSALRSIAFDGASLFDVRTDILILLLWGVIAYALTIKFFRWE